MEKIYQANIHLPILLALTLISVGCTINSKIKLPKLKLNKVFKK